MALSWVVMAVVATWGASAYIQPTDTLTDSNSSFSELTTLLSGDAALHFPDTAPYSVATSRWSAYMPAHFDVVVEVATEEDVSQVIRYANLHDLPFLAISGSHGQNIHMGDVHHGIGIWMRKMDDVTISDDGQSAVIGGGIMTKAMADKIWEKGKMSVWPVCECTGAIAPLLGGGHGWLQGQYGLMADNLISARMVLANGTAITVSSSEHTDLFWAIRGAGHNFGILTSMVYRVYDRTPDNEQWTLVTSIFTEDKLESVFTAANAMMEEYGDKDVRLGHWAQIIRIPDVHPLPVVVVLMTYQGSSIPSHYMDIFEALEPIVQTTLPTNLLGLAKPFTVDVDGPSCQHFANFIPFPFGAKKYPIEGVRKGYEALVDLPSSFNQSWIVFEGYSSRGVRTVPAESTAYPERHNDMLMSGFILYEREAKDLDSEAVKWGQKLRSEVRGDNAGPLNAYVNYVQGDETEEEIYGHEPWRLEKLRKVKSLYDPEGRFNHYNPISLGSRVGEGKNKGKAEIVKDEL